VATTSPLRVSITRQGDRDRAFESTGIRQFAQNAGSLGPLPLLFFRTRLSRLSQHGFATFSKTTTEVLDEGWKNSFNATFNEPAQDEKMQQIVLGEYCDEERDDAQATTDPGVRVPLYQEISQNMHDAYT
jgi:hypothetical protein